jgi:predicted  nucleic acid-binding Zn-ribbon protein
MKRWECKNCTRRFETGDEIYIAVCPQCKSKNTRGTNLVPPKGYIRAFELYQSVKCRECGRPLRSEKSIARGFGLTCGTYYAEKWLDTHPDELGEKAKKRWTQEEVDKLIKFALERNTKKAQGS